MKESPSSPSALLDRPLHRSLFHSLAKSQTNYFVRLDLAGNYQFVNPAFEEMFGPKEHFLGKHYRHSVHPDDIEKCERAGQQCVQYPEQAVAIELRKPQTDGSYNVTWWEFIAVTNEDNEVVEVDALGYDISNDRATQHRLERANDLNRLLVTLSDQLINILPSTRDATINHVLASVARFLGFKRGLFHRIDQQYQHARLTHEYTAAQTSPLPTPFCNLSIDRFPAWRNKVYCHESIVIEDIDQFPQSAKHLIEQELPDLVSAVSVPIVHQGTLLGYVGFVDDQVHPRLGEVLESLQLLGKLFGSALHQADLTQDLQASQGELLSSEKKFRSLTEHSFDAIIVYDKEGIITYASPSVESVIGYTPKELVGSSGCAYTFSKDESVALKLLDDALAHPEVRVSGEMRLAHKNGRIIWVETVLTNWLHDESIRGVVSNFRDVTGRHQGKQAVAEYSKRLELATQSANIGIWDWHIPENRLMWDTRASNILGLNSAYSAFYKESISEVIETWLEIIHADDKDRVRRKMEEALQSADSLAIEYRVVRPDNHEERYVKIYAKILCEDKPVRMTGAIRDTTEIKTTEQQLRHHIDALQKTNAELDQFVYSTSHNLRSPLASILGLVSILQEETDHLEQKQYLQLVEASIHRLDSTISSIIDYSRNTRVEVAAEPINFHKMVAEIIDSLYFLLHAVNVRVTTRLPDDTISFATDAHRLKVIISNLLSNSIKYFNPQAVQPWVDISVSATEEGVSILIEDNGIGIPGAMQDRIFDMFFRASEQSSGSGLGLYIVKETVEKLGGTISMTSQVGKGSAFTVRLPSLAGQN